MLYPSQDREIRRLVFRCRNCGQCEDVEENCIYVNELVKDTRCVCSLRLSIAAVSWTVAD